jgi:hypothetical protein
VQYTQAGQSSCGEPGNVPAAEPAAAGEVTAETVPSLADKLSRPSDEEPTGETAFDKSIGKAPPLLRFLDPTLSALAPCFPLLLLATPFLFEVEIFPVETSCIPAPFELRTDNNAPPLEPFFGFGMLYIGVV